MSSNNSEARIWDMMTLLELPLPAMPNGNNDNKYNNMNPEYADFCISTENSVVTDLKSLYPNLKHSCAVFCILAAVRESWRKYKAEHPRTKGPTELTFAYIVELCKGESWDGVSDVQLTPAECYQFFKEFQLGLVFTSNK
jgi:hypothetical protein